MRKTPALILGITIAFIAVCVLIKAQSGSRTRTPVLNTDDLRPTPRDTVRVPDRETPSSPNGDPEVVRGAIAWQRDLRRALQVASAEGKVIVADVYTDWCGWCKKMDKTIYTDPEIVALSRQQVFVKMNAEDRGDGESFARDMGVRSYPTTIILDGRGRVLDIAKGYIESPQAFLEFVESAHARKQADR